MTPTTAMPETHGRSPNCAPTSLVPIKVVVVTPALIISPVAFSIGTGTPAQLGTGRLSHWIARHELRSRCNPKAQPGMQAADFSPIVASCLALPCALPCSTDGMLRYGPVAGCACRAGCSLELRRGLHLWLQVYQLFVCYDSLPVTHWLACHGAVGCGAAAGCYEAETETGTGDREVKNTTVQFSMAMAGSAWAGPAWAGPARN